VARSQRSGEQVMIRSLAKFEQILVAAGAKESLAVVRGSKPIPFRHRREAVRIGEQGPQPESEQVRIIRREEVIATKQLRNASDV
jgi:hypothetical protein